MNVYDTVKSILRNKAVICLILVSAFSAFTSSIAAQLTNTPNPQEVKKKIKQKLESDMYITWNYYVSGKQPPGTYSGPQEGGPRDPHEVEKEIKAYLPKQNKYISEEPFQSPLYESRGVSYAKLYEVTKDLDERATYAERALADFNKAIELEPSLWSAFEQRAGLLKSVDFFAYFDFIVSDYLEEINLIKSFCAKHPELAKSYNTTIPKLYLTISRNYWIRAKVLSQEPKLLTEISRLHKQYSRYSYWKDFDTAIKYAQEDMVEPNEVGIIINYLIDKGDAAYRVGKYKIALETYDAGMEYWDKTTEVYCKNNPNLCDSHKKQEKDYTFRIRLIKVYVKLEKWETALDNLNYFLSNTPNVYCPEPYLVRAQIYRQLGKISLAIADEQTASKLPPPQVSCYESVERWK